MTRRRSGCRGAGRRQGFSGATINPFTVGVAQGIAEVEYTSGAGFRVICHAVMLIVAAAIVSATH